VGFRSGEKFESHVVLRAAERRKIFDRRTAGKFENSVVIIPWLEHTKNRNSPRRIKN